MGRNTEAKCRLCRREKEKLFLKGQRCITEKCAFAKRAFPPGQHGKLPGRTSEFGIRLREKQKARRVYGITESQFEKYFAEAARHRGATGEKLLEFLERRLDNVVYRLGFAASRQAARQLVRHGRVRVNDHKVNIPSYRVETGEVISFKDKAQTQLKAVKEADPDHQPPIWLEVSGEFSGKVVALPKRENIDTVLADHLVVEYYSR